MKTALLMSVLTAAAAFGEIRIIVFGAHPDDCDFRAAGTAAHFVKLGHKVKFVAITNGDAGHQIQGGGDLARRRRAEAMESARRLGIEAEVLENHDGELLPTIDVRKQVIRQIRLWNADVVIAPRPNDYHPDHRYTGVLIQDAAYMVVVPNILSDVPALKKNPVFLYQQDNFQRPNPFRPDIAVDLDPVWEKKVDAMDAHVSQVYEWLPWVDGKLDTVPKGLAERRKWLAETRAFTPNPTVRAALVKWYGAERGAQVKHAEAFEVCEYGRQPSEADLRQLFPMLGK